MPKGDPKPLTGDRWRTRVYLGRDPVTGRQITRTHTYEAKGIKAARRIAGELERQSKASAGARETFGQAVETWYAQWAKDEHSPTTVREYRRIIDARLSKMALWRRQVDTLTVTDFDALYAHLDKAGRVRVRKDEAGNEVKGLSPTTVRRVHAVTRQVGNDMARRGLTPVNLVELASLPKGRRYEMRIPTDSELTEIISAAEKRGFTRAVCFLLAAGTAMRRGELVGLRWSRVNLATGEVLIDTASVMGGQKLDPATGKVIVDTKSKGQLKTTKTKNAATLVLLPEVTEALRRLQARQVAAFRSMRVEVPDDWFVFSTVPPFDRPQREDGLTAWFRQACKDAGVQGVRLHDLRHWAVSNALALGVAPTDVQAMSRHLSLKTMLDVYGHAVSDAAQRATGVLRLPKLAPAELEG